MRCSAILGWMEKPLDLSEEKLSIGGITTLALLFIGLAAFCYFKGIGSAAYNHNFAYSLWGISGGIVLATTISYIARSIVSQKKQSVTQQIDQQEFKKDVLKRQDWLQEVYDALFDVRLAELPDYEPNLIGTTGYFDQTQNLEFTDTNVIRGLHKGKSFIGLRLAVIENNQKKDCRMLIGLNSQARWAASTQNDILEFQCSRSLQECDVEARQFLGWLKGLLEGNTLYLFKYESNLADEGNGKSLVEDKEGPTVSLWQDD